MSGHLFSHDPEKYVRLALMFSTVILLVSLISLIAACLTGFTLARIGAIPYKGAIRRALRARFRSDWLCYSVMPKVYWRSFINLCRGKPQDPTDRLLRYGSFGKTYRVIPYYRLLLIDNILCERKSYAESALHIGHSLEVKIGGEMALEAKKTYRRFELFFSSGFRFFFVALFIGIIFLSFTKSLFDLIYIVAGLAVFNFIALIILWIFSGLNFRSSVELAVSLLSPDVTPDDFKHQVERLGFSITKRL